jgi:hypothetical protein
MRNRKLCGELEPAIAIEPTLGAAFSILAAALILALRETLLRHGVAAAELHRLIHDGFYPNVVVSTLSHDAQ